MLTLSREFYIPKEATAEAVEDAAAVLYRYTRAGKPYALGFQGKAQKPAFHFSFRDESRREIFLADFITKARARIAARAERKAARVAFQHSLKVGDVLRNSWGYDQTNIDYFQVVEVHGKAVVIRELAQERTETGWLQGTCSPKPGSFIGEPLRKIVQQGNAVKIHAWGSYAHPVPATDTSRWSAYA